LLWWLVFLSHDCRDWLRQDVSIASGKAAFSLRKVLSNIIEDITVGVILGPGTIEEDGPAADTNAHCSEPITMQMSEYTQKTKR
jgi:hypothetical protein